MDIPTLEARRAELQADIKTLRQQVDSNSAQLLRVEGAVLCLNELIEIMQSEEVPKAVKGKDERPPTTSAVRQHKARTT
jgi:hypothetical protein